jgi:hypothetical protein
LELLSLLGVLALDWVTRSKSSDLAIEDPIELLLRCPDSGHEQERSMRYRALPEIS